MRFVNPAGLWLGLLAIPVLLVHMLRPRRAPVSVSSTFLWRSVTQPVSAAKPWDRLRWSLPLILQLLLVALMTMAVARPVRVTGSPLAQHTVFIVDATGSMLARDGAPDRLDAAKSRVLSMFDELPDGGKASLVVVDSQPKVLLATSSSKAEMSRALASVHARPSAGDFAAAFALASGLETPNEPIGFVLVSDGGVTAEEERLIPAGTAYERVGEADNNRAITSLVVEQRARGIHARATIRNGGSGVSQSVRIDVDGRTITRADVSLDAGASRTVEFDVPSGERVEVFLEGEDLVGEDNHAYAVVSRAAVRKVLLVGPGNPFLEELLAAFPDMNVEFSETSRSADGYDLVIYDRVDVPPRPGVPYLAIASPNGAPGLSVVGEVERPELTLVRADHPVLAGVDLSSVAISHAQRVAVSGDLVLIGAEGAPLLVQGARAGVRFAYLSFEIGNSNLPLQVAYPVAFQRLFAELAGVATIGADIQVGASLPVVLDDAATVISPHGARHEVVRGAAGPIADEPGFWSIERDAKPTTVVAVNASSAEADVSPRASLAVAQRSARPGERALRGEIPLLRWVLAFAFVLLVAEFVASRRRRGVTRRQWKTASLVRAAVGALLVAAAFDLAVVRDATHVATVFLIDGSDSMGTSGRENAVAWVSESLRSQPSGARAGIAVFGGDARVESTVQHRLQITAPSVRVDASRTDLAGALRLASAMLPREAKRRVVVVSDGRPTKGDAAAEVERLREQGVVVEAHPVVVGSARDVAVARVVGPSLARKGESFAIRATLSSTVSVDVRVVLERDDAVIDERVVSVRSGETVVEFTQVATDTGLGRYTVRIDGPTGLPQNDIGYAIVPFDGPGKVLVVDGSTRAEPFIAALRASGMTVDVVEPNAFPSLERLSAYSATVLVDVDLLTLSSEQLRALSSATRDLGHGLVTIGGDHSYAPGGYLNSELELLLPVISEIKDPLRRQKVAQVLAIDTSGSMGACHCADGGQGLGVGGRVAGGVNKTDIARSAAARTIDALSTSDEVGVLAFNTAEKWVIPLQELPSNDVVTKGLGSLAPGGGTNVSSSLSTAAESLRKSKASLKHIILFTDGFTAPGALEGLADQAASLAAEGVTVSVLATGEGSAQQLSRIAEAGRGRFYAGKDLQQIPQIMMQEALTVARDFVNEGQFVPRITSNAEVVRSLTQAPPIFGYVATTEKPTATVHMRIGPDDDPLLASWQTGLGRVTSWTSDASARWSQAWASWPGYVAFWAGVVKDTFPAQGGGGVAARIDFGLDTARIIVESQQPLADGATANGRLTTPGGSGTSIEFERTSATSFAAEVPATDAGTYAAGVSIGVGADSFATTAVGVRSYSLEYKPGSPDPAYLEGLSTRSGGRGAIEAAQAFDASGLRPGRHRIVLTPWLLLLAALLLPVAVVLGRVGWRRLDGELAVRPTATPSTVDQLLGRGYARRRDGDSLVVASSPGSRSDDSPRPVAPPDATGAAADVAETLAAPSADGDTLARLLDRKRGARPPH